MVGKQQLNICLCWLRASLLNPDHWFGCGVVVDTPSLPNKIRRDCRSKALYSDTHRWLVTNLVLARQTFGSANSQRDNGLTGITGCINWIHGNIQRDKSSP